MRDVREMWHGKADTRLRREVDVDGVVSYVVEIFDNDGETMGEMVAPNSRIGEPGFGGIVFLFDRDTGEHTGHFQLNMVENWRDVDQWRQDIDPKTGEFFPDGQRMNEYYHLTFDANAVDDIENVMDTIKGYGSKVDVNCNMELVEVISLKIYCMEVLEEIAKVVPRESILSIMLMSEGGKIWKTIKNL